MSMNHQCINSDDNLISLTKRSRHYRLRCEIKQKTVSYSNRSYLLLLPHTALYANLII